ncbi:phytoene/squalene synthase family protein [Roseobacter sp. HKCCA0434]|uniref:phytoene/squalene synthase family protein n=1 Tax=Roseobacter sp. HKCCA0434 TaxID=3079297 RepID=UPI002905D0C3|nr:phytoene/squalene synthase family protein [Roseobacter sp. HKCCA0434]
MIDRVAKLSHDSIAKGSQSFALAARLFAPRMREDCVMLYAWCRHTDDVIDGQVAGHGQDPRYREGQSARLDALREETDVALHTDTPVSAPFEALRRVARRHAIPAAHPHALLDGFAMDADRRSYPTLGALHDYCYHVAGVVGVMMARIMGARDPATLDRACDLGLAFQLTNICRDVIDDARAGRVYLPTDLLAAEGIGQVDPDDRGQSAGLHRVVLRLLDDADRYYDSALHGIAELPARPALAIAAARRIYREIGERLRAEGPAAWDSRISTPTARKLALIASAGADTARLKLRAPAPAPRHGLYTRPHDVEAAG